MLRNFTSFCLVDHKPLLRLFGENKPLPEHASPRIQRWAITLTAYNYELKYKPGSENSADSLSRLPLKNQSLSYVPDLDYQSELPKQSICNLINDYGDMAISNVLKKIH